MFSLLQVSKDTLESCPMLETGPFKVLTKLGGREGQVRSDALYQVVQAPDSLTKILPRRGKLLNRSIIGRIEIRAWFHWGGDLFTVSHIEGVEDRLDIMFLR